MSITADERWKLFVLFQEATQKAEEKGKTWARIDRPGSMDSCNNAREALVQANKNFREFLDTLVDPLSVATVSAKAQSDLAAIFNRRR